MVIIRLYHWWVFTIVKACFPCSKPLMFFWKIFPWIPHKAHSNCISNKQCTDPQLEKGCHKLLDGNAPNVLAGKLQSWWRYIFEILECKTAVKKWKNTFHSNISRLGKRGSFKQFDFKDDSNSEQSIKISVEKSLITNNPPNIQLPNLHNIKYHHIETDLLRFSSSASILSVGWLCFKHPCLSYFLALICILIAKISSQKIARSTLTIQSINKVCSHFIFFHLDPWHQLQYDHMIELKPPLRTQE